MEFDETKYYLGKLCKRKHEYGNTGQSLRYIKSAKQCVVCGRLFSQEHLNKNKDKKYEYNRNWYSNNKLNRRIYQLKYEYGIDLDDYQFMFDSQLHKCKLCGKELKFLDRHTCVDHNHETGEIRGLLCRDCNISLGRFNDDPNLLEKAIKYLKGLL